MSDDDLWDEANPPEQWRSDVLKYLNSIRLALYLILGCLVGLGLRLTFTNWHGGFWPFH